MSDTGIGFYLAMGIGILVAIRLAFCGLNFIKFAIKFLLSKKK